MCFDKPVTGNMFMKYRSIYQTLDDDAYYERPDLEPESAEHLLVDIDKIAIYKYPISLSIESKDLHSEDTVSPELHLAA